MSGQELTDEIPAAYRDKHGVSTLSDPEDVPITESVGKDARSFAESSVQAVQRLIFPTHGLRSA